MAKLIIRVAVASAIWFALSHYCGCGAGDLPDPLPVDAQGRPIPPIE